MGICCMSQGTQTGALYQPRGVGDGREMGGRFKREGAYVHLWLIHVDVWQKTKFCKAIILQLKNKLIKKEEKAMYNGQEPCDAGANYSTSPQQPTLLQWVLLIL